MTFLDGSITIWDVVVVAFASFWSAYVIVYLDGPFYVFERTRRKFNVYDLGVDGEPKTLLGRIFACPVCIGFYTSAFFLLCMMLNRSYMDLFVLLFAIPGLQTTIHFITSE
jgi:hypothetical protein